MRYIIMCGGPTLQEPIPRPLRVVYGEELVSRTIRLLRNHGVKDISISGGDDRFKKFGVPVINEHHDRYLWVNCFYHSEEPTCYLFGDVFYSAQAIQTIINTETDDIEFFASAEPFSKWYVKEWAEPFAFKVVNTKRFQECIDTAIMLYNKNRIYRVIAWELWQVIKGTELNVIQTNYTVINDYTCDIDGDEEAEQLQRKLKALCPSI